jgi:hypothetical protein
MYPLQLAQFGHPINGDPYSIRLISYGLSVLLTNQNEVGCPNKSNPNMKSFFNINLNCE